MTAVFPGHASQGADPAAASLRPARPSARAEAERADALFALALGLVTEGDEGDAAIEAVLGAAGAIGDRGVLTGAYGRALAFSAQYPDDPTARQTVQVLAKALSHHHRHRAVAPPA